MWLRDPQRGRKVQKSVNPLQSHADYSEELCIYMGHASQIKGLGVHNVTSKYIAYFILLAHYKAIIEILELSVIVMSWGGKKPNLWM